ncbi:MAG: chemotaxis protein CheW [Desulfomonilaceae bacterium]|nr:chemotaxis protein CheW [Desulfomonilaceae bacterium]
MAGWTQVVAFALDELRFAVTLSQVERIVRAVEITPLPDAPKTVHGIINVEGRIVPVVNTRKRLGISEREIELDDLFVIVNGDGRSLALVADEVLPVLEIPDKLLVPSDDVLPGKRFVQGIADTDNGMIMILDIDKALTYEEHGDLQRIVGALSED